MVKRRRYLACVLLIFDGLHEGDSFIVSVGPPHRVGWGHQILAAASEDEVLVTNDDSLNKLEFDNVERSEEEENEGLSLLEDDNLIESTVLEEDMDLDDESVSDLFSDDVDEEMLTTGPISLEDLKSLTTTKNNIAYFYLKNEIGLDEGDMWRVTYEAGTALGMTAKNLRRKVDLMRRLMDLSDDDVRTMLRRFPAVLHLSAKQNLAPTIMFLQRSLDLSREDLRAMIVQFPSILAYSIANLKSKLNFYLKLCSFSKDEARKLFVSEPKLLTAGVETGLIPRLHFFVSELGFPIEDLREIIQKNPRLLLYSVENNLQPKLIFYLIMTLGMTTDQVHKLLKKYPQFVDYNLDNHVLPITRYFKEDLLYGNPEFVQILLKFPRLVTWSLRKIKHVAGYLRYELGMDAAQVKRVLYQAPTVINLNTEETLKKKVEFLRNILNLTEFELRKVLAGMPTITICSLEANLMPKIEYLKEILGDEELKAAVLIQPTLLGYSLEKRIKPRMELLMEAEVHPRAITVGISQAEEAFQSWLRGRRYKAQINKASDPINLPERRSDRKALIAASGSADGRIVHWTRERKSPPTSP